MEGYRQKTVGRRSLAWRLRELRQPLVALCAVLLLGNLLAPAAVFGAPADDTYLCHGAPPSPHGDDAPAHPVSQHCCFAAALALVGDAAPVLALLAPRPDAPLPGFAAAPRTRRLASTARIRAPPAA
ncbi:MAG: hypothetical protein AcusKO_41180 [Acuticoccus sp.]